MTENQPTSQSLFSTTWNDATEDDTAYTKVSITALLSLMFGLASFLVFMTPWLFFLSVLGIVFSFVSIYLVAKSDGALTGIRAAYSGLSLSIISLIAVATLWPFYQYGVRKEADRFFRVWFQELARENIPLAKGLTALYWERKIPKDAETWWKEQYDNSFSHKSIHSYTDNKLIRILLALGDKAKVTYYKTLSVQTGDDKDTVVAVYAVSYPAEGPEKGKTETFFVKMTGKRQFPSGDVKSAGWALEGLPVLYVPDEFKETAKTPGGGPATNEKK